MPLLRFDSEEILYYCVSILVLVTFSSGFTRFFAASFDKRRSEKTEGFDFNPLTNLDIIGTIVFFLGGFGWGRQADEQKIRFQRQKLGWLLISLVAPYASLSFAMAAAYVKYFFWTDRVVDVLVQLSVAVTAYHIIPIPPLFGSRLIYLILPGERIWRLYSKIGPYLILTLVLVDRFSGTPFLREMMAPVVELIARFAVYY